jgi:hypothetical protein
VVAHRRAGFERRAAGFRTRPGRREGQRLLGSSRSGQRCEAGWGRFAADIESAREPGSARGVAVARRCQRRWQTASRRHRDCACKVCRHACRVCRPIGTVEGFTQRHWVLGPGFWILVGGDRRVLASAQPGILPQGRFHGMVEDGAHCVWLESRDHGWSRIENGQFNAVIVGGTLTLVRFLFD